MTCKRNAAAAIHRLQRQARTRAAFERDLEDLKRELDGIQTLPRGLLPSTVALEALTLKLRNLRRRWRRFQAASAFFTATGAPQ